jgi:hypothetical protein
MVASTKLGQRLGLSLGFSVDARGMNRCLDVVGRVLVGMMVKLEI